MIRNKLIKICLLAIGVISIFAPQVWAVKILESSQTAKDRIDSNSEAIPLPGRIGYRPGVPYKFEAQAGDEITVYCQPQPKRCLISPVKNLHQFSC
jgi:hypothetical protein